MKALSTVSVFSLCMIFSLEAFSSECIWKMRLRFFMSPTENSVVVDAGFDHYKLTTVTCPSLPEASRINYRILSGLNELCPGDVVVPRDRRGRILDVCEITEITKLE